MSLANNVLEFINKASAVVGRYENDYFNQTIWSECQGRGIESPIEQILYGAILTVARINYIERCEEQVEDSGKHHMPGLITQPQRKIGNYRVDFAIHHEQKMYNPERWESKVVLVECDSQQFHERTERERRYEKQRDRYLISQGHTVLHFTGSEIVQEPFRVASEILESVCTHRPNASELLACVEEYLD